MTNQNDASKHAIIINHDKKEFIIIEFTNTDHLLAWILEQHDPHTSPTAHLPSIFHIIDHRPNVQEIDEISNKIQEVSGVPYRLKWALRRLR
jgi:hypothetical protein